MKKVLIMSDTHGDRTLYKKIIELEKPDIKVHAGDFCISVSEMEKNFDYFVAGNNDYDGEKVIDFKIDNFLCRLMHGDMFGYYGMFGFNKRENKLWSYAKENHIDIFISGHTHVELVYYKDNILVVNPGSLMYPRNKSLRQSYAILYIENNTIQSTEFNDIIKYIN